MASNPNGRSRNPFPYLTEMMTGFESTDAVGMRHEGRKRSSFNEAGHSSQRSNRILIGSPGLARSAAAAEPSLTATSTRPWLLTRKKGRLSLTSA